MGNQPSCKRAYSSFFTFYCWKNVTALTEDKRFGEMKTQITKGVDYLVLLMLLNFADMIRKIEKYPAKSEELNEYYESLKTYDISIIAELEQKKKDSPKDVPKNKYIASLFSSGLEELYRAVPGGPLDDFYKVMIGYVRQMNMNDLTKPLMDFFMKTKEISDNFKKYEDVPRTTILSKPPFNPIEILPTLSSYYLEPFLEDSEFSRKFLDFFFDLMLLSTLNEKNLNEYLFRPAFELKNLLIDTVNRQNPDAAQRTQKLMESCLAIVADFTESEGKIQKISKEVKSEMLSSFLGAIILKNEFLKKTLSIKTISEILSLVNKLSKEPIKSLNDSSFVRSLMKLLKTIGGKMGFDEKPIEGIINLITGDFGKVDHLILKLGRNKKNVLEGYKKIVAGLIKLDIFASERKEINFAQIQDDTEWREIMKKVKDNEATAKDLFKMVDMANNGDGSIDKREFSILATRLGNSLSDHRINEIFAEIKKKNQNADQEKLDEDEFEEGLKYLQKKNVSMSLEIMGISMSTLAGILAMLVTLLLLLFSFIFVGIQAFALGGSFGAVINSLIPAAAGLGIGQSNESKEEKLEDEKVEESVQTTKKILTSKNLD
eukprot:TRINITY_DN433_c0_g4_i1.p1 TRINITY_DN433_c0_g4~~TRINITY_DN433_c0_g4_i1.p1  ORF type:complete len:602 (+),score=126.29 TRINITY_DN433_c0_g4_i1:109-1914(+)